MTYKDKAEAVLDLVDEYYRRHDLYGTEHDHENLHDLVAHLGLGMEDYIKFRRTDKLPAHYEPPLSLDWRVDDIPDRTPRERATDKVVSVIIALIIGGFIWGLIRLTEVHR